MTGFLKKLTTRSRGNSYVDDDYTGASPRGDPSNNRPPTSYQSPTRGYSQSPSGIDHRTPASATLDSKDADNMYPSRHDAGYSAPPPPPSSAGRTTMNGTGAGMRTSAHMHHDSMRDSGFGDATTPMSPHKGSGGVGGAAAGGGVQAPDLLTHAFNEALRPHTEKIEMLEEQLAQMQEWVREQEQQRLEIYSWIDKRGLRPGMHFPPQTHTHIPLSNPHSA